VGCRAGLQSEVEDSEERKETVSFDLAISGSYEPPDSTLVTLASQSAATSLSALKLNSSDSSSALSNATASHEAVNVCILDASLNVIGTDTLENNEYNIPVKTEDTQDTLNSGSEHTFYVVISNGIQATMALHTSDFNTLQALDGQYNSGSTSVTTTLPVIDMYGDYNILENAAKSCKNILLPSGDITLPPVQTSLSNKSNIYKLLWRSELITDILKNPNALDQDSSGMSIAVNALAFIFDPTPAGAKNIGQKLSPAMATRIQSVINISESTMNNLVGKMHDNKTLMTKIMGAIEKDSSINLGVQKKVIDAALYDRKLFDQMASYDDDISSFTNLVMKAGKEYSTHQDIRSALGGKKAESLAKMAQKGNQAILEKFFIGVTSQIEDAFDTIVNCLDTFDTNAENSRVALANCGILNDDGEVNTSFVENIVEEKEGSVKFINYQFSENKTFGNETARFCGNLPSFLSPQSFCQKNISPQTSCHTIDGFGDSVNMPVCVYTCSTGDDAYCQEKGLGCCHQVTENGKALNICAPANICNDNNQGDQNDNGNQDNNEEEEEEEDDDDAVADACPSLSDDSAYNEANLRIFCLCIDDDGGCTASGNANSAACTTCYNLVNTNVCNTNDYQTNMGACWDRIQEVFGGNDDDNGEQPILLVGQVRRANMNDVGDYSDERERYEASFVFIPQTTMRHTIRVSGGANGLTGSDGNTGIQYVQGNTNLGTQYSTNSYGIYCIYTNDNLTANAQHKVVVTSEGADDDLTLMVTEGDDCDDPIPAPNWINDGNDYASIFNGNACDDPDPINWESSFSYNYIDANLGTSCAKCTSPYARVLDDASQCINGGSIGDATSTHHACHQWCNTDETASVTDACNADNSGCDEAFSNDDENSFGDTWGLSASTSSCEATITYADDDDNDMGGKAILDATGNACDNGFYKYRKVADDPKNATFVLKTSDWENFATNSDRFLELRLTTFSGNSCTNENEIIDWISVGFFANANGKYCRARTSDDGEIGNAGTDADNTCDLGDDYNRASADDTVDLQLVKTANAVQAQIVVNDGAPTNIGNSFSLLGDGGFGCWRIEIGTKGIFHLGDFDTSNITFWE
jgi:hypothetical protein